MFNKHKKKQIQEAINDLDNLVRTEDGESYTIQYKMKQMRTWIDRIVADHGLTDAQEELLTSHSYSQGYTASNGPWINTDLPVAIPQRRAAIAATKDKNK